MKTSAECREKAEALEREASEAGNSLRREAYLELAEHWRRLAARCDAGLDNPAPQRLWPKRDPRLH